MLKREGAENILLPSRGGCRGEAVKEVETLFFTESKDWVER